MRCLWENRRTFQVCRMQPDILLWRSITTTIIVPFPFSFFLLLFYAYPTNSIYFHPFFIFSFIHFFKECQLKDWSRHENECQMLQRGQRIRQQQQQHQPPPSPSHSLSNSYHSSTYSTANELSNSAPSRGAYATPSRDTSGHSSQQNFSSSYGHPAPSRPRAPSIGNVHPKEEEEEKEKKSVPEQGDAAGGTAASAAGRSTEGEGEETSRWNKMARFMKDKKESAMKGVMNLKDSVAEMHLGEKTKRAFESVKFGSDQPTQEELEQAQNNDIEELLAPPKPDDPHAIFGVPYEVAVERSASIIPGIPDVVVFCLAFLDRFGFEEEGIFRLSGSKREIAILRGLFQAGGSPPKGNMTTQHSITGLLKLYFRELPEGIFSKRKTVPQNPSQNKYRCVYDSLYDPFKPVVPFLFYFLRKVIKLLIPHLNFPNPIVIHSTLHLCSL